MERRFHCTACGKCCSGLLPLTLADAFAHAGRFPLAMVWTPLRQQSKAFDLVRHIGAVVNLSGRRRIAVIIVPTAYIPDSFFCPALNADGRCAIHARKPLRCRTMPFYPYREERDQADLLTPRKGWDCDTSAAAPVVYRERKIVAREDFDLERRELLAQAPLIRAYAEYMMKYMPQLADKLATAAMHGAGGNVVTSLSSYLTATRQLDIPGFAATQLSVLKDFAAKTAGHADLAEFHRNYAGWAKEMEYLAERGSRSG
jgi:Fe-S-cluster containining protein